jgi:hypothetical protein
MALFERRIRPATAPAEPPVPDEAKVADIDDKLGVLARTVNRVPGVCDWLIDRRNAIRPGRPGQDPIESIIDNRRENP